MRTLAVLALASLFPLSSFAQSVWLDIGQSGFYTEGGYAWADQISGYGVDLGYSADGRSDFGLSFTKSTYTTHYSFPDGYSYDASFDVHTTTQFFQAHVIKREAENGSAFMLTASEQFSFQGDSFLPDNDSFNNLILGLHATSRFGPKPYTALLVSVGYLRAIPMETGFDASGIVSLRAGVGVYTGRSVFGLNFEIGADESITSYAVSVSIGNLIHERPEGSF